MYLKQLEQLTGFDFRIFVLFIAKTTEHFTIMYTNLLVIPACTSDADVQAVLIVLFTGIFFKML